MGSAAVDELPALTGSYPTAAPEANGQEPPPEPTDLILNLL